MDLRLFHNGEDGPDRNFKMKDRFNGWTKLPACRFLEWSGWYSMEIGQRLLGHYRLFQHFKINYKNEPREYPAAQAYIYQYRGSHSIKSFLSRTISLIYSIGTLKKYYPVVEVSAINRQLINESSDILYDFLTHAETDFEVAFHTAMEKIRHPSFFNKKDNNPGEVNFQVVLKEGALGKQKGVFSKKQMLIFFDLLSQSAKLEAIDFRKPNKFGDLATLFHAITGKGKKSFMEELNNYRNKDLYGFHTQGELSQLIIILVNLAETFRSAGFRSVASLADKKIKELESMKKD